MDKTEYKIRADEINSLIEKKNFKEAVKIADTIDWRRVRSVSMLCKVSEIYKVNRKYEESKEILLLANDLQPGSRKIIYSLCELCIKLQEEVEAVEYCKEFMKIAPKDSGRYILQYRLYEAQDVSLEERIAVLEEYKAHDYREKWAYELAYLYHRIGLATRCVEECDELILWFGEGKYVIKAMELKMLHAPLTLQQQEKYNERFLQKEMDVEEKGQEEQPQVEVSMPIEIKPVDITTAKTSRIPTKKILSREKFKDILSTTQKIDDIENEQDEEAEEVMPTESQIVQNAYEIEEEENTSEAEENQETNELEGIENSTEVENTMEDENEEANEEELEDISDDEESAKENDIEESEEEIDHNQEDEKMVSSEAEITIPNDYDGIQVKTIDINDECNTINLQSVVAEGINQLFQKEDMVADDATKALPIDSIYEITKQIENEQNNEDENPVEEYIDEVMKDETVEADREESAKDSKEEVDSVKETMEEVIGDSSDEEDIPAESDLSEKEAENTVSEEMKESSEVKEEEIEEENIAADAEEENSVEEVIEEGMDDESVEDNKEDSTKDSLEEVNSVKETMEEVIGDSSDEEDIPAESDLSEKEAKNTVSEEMKESSEVKEEKIEEENIAADAEEEIEEENVAGDAEEENSVEEVIEEGMDDESVEDSKEESTKESKAELNIEPLIYHTNEPLSEALIQAVQSVAIEAAKEAAIQAAKEAAQATAQALREQEEAKALEKAKTLEEEKSLEKNDLEENQSSSEEIPVTEKESEENNSEENAIEKQITGQLSFADIMAEWEKTKKENEEKNIEKIRQKVLDQTGPLFSDTRTIPFGAEDNGLDMISPVLDVFSDSENMDSSKETEKDDTYTNKASDVEEITTASDDTSDLDITEELDQETDNLAREVENALEEEIKMQVDSESDYKEKDSTEDESSYTVKQKDDSETEKEPEKQIKDEETEQIEESSEKQTEDSPLAGLEVSQENESQDNSDEMEDRKNFFNTEEINGLEEKLMEALDEQHYETANIQVKALEEEMNKDEENTDSDKNDKSEDEASVIESSESENSENQDNKKDENEDTQEKERLQDENGNRKLTREEKNLFSQIAQTKEMQDKIAGVIDTISLEPLTGNLMVIGERGTGAVDVAQSFVENLAKKNPHFSGKSVVVTAEELERKDISSFIKEYEKGAIIIDQAGNMKAENFKKMHEQVSKEQDRILFILVDTRDDMDRLLKECPNVKDHFNAEISIDVLDNDGLVRYGQEYANSLDYAIDEMGILALYNRIEEKQTSDHVVTVDEVKEIINEAIERVGKKSFSHAMDIIFGKRYDQDNMIMLREKDFLVK